MSKDHVRALQEARTRCRPIRRACLVASISGWSLGVFAALTLVFSILSVQGLLLGAALGAVAWRELQGAKLMRQFSRMAPKMLALNQVALAVILTIYGLWGIGYTLLAPSPYAAQMAEGGRMARMVEGIASLHLVLSIAVYSATVIGGVLVTGTTALYYISRRSRIEKFLRQTPAWVVQTLRASQ